jgi:2-C-methyl-D-erythritol 2,4-cyclodiphosphate synthase
MKIRVGFGYDVHQLAEDQTLIIGGIAIPHTKGAVGHSDADVLLHAISDALLGAANLRDIGFHFPPSDDQYKGIDSKILLKKVMDLLNSKGYKVGNVDATVALELPKLNPHIPEMQRTIAEILHLTSEEVSLKATTSERMGFVGREEGIAAYATVLIARKD